MRRLRLPFSSFFASIIKGFRYLNRHLKEANDNIPYDSSLKYIVQVNWLKTREYFGIVKRG